MLKTIIVSVREALAHFRSNVFHTLLSVLGIVIGVAALVGILSMIDGLEQYAHQQISETTSLEVISMRPITSKKVNGVRIQNDSFINLDYKTFKYFRDRQADDVQMMMSVTHNELLKVPNDTMNIGAIVNFTSVPYSLNPPELLYGRNLEEKDQELSTHSLFVNANLAKAIVGENEMESAVGKNVLIRGRSYQIIGIRQAEPNDPPFAWAPITTLDSNYWKNTTRAHTINFKAPEVEQVDLLEDSLKAQLARLHPGQVDDFEFIKNESRLAQVDQGFMLFRLIMGFIVGISVLVGGIGVMNVLLISVTERTREIGLRKAMGARRRDIIVQFLAESTTISLIGSLMGLILGVLGSLLFVPIVKALTKAPFQVAFTANTLLVITIIALLIGILFGTYPALRAARLDPVDAIRRE